MLSYFKIAWKIFAAIVRLICFYSGVFLQGLLGYPLETFRLTPDGIKQVPTRYRNRSAARRFFFV